MYKDFKKSPGFTLIELLVVIVIIGILATLATVALNSARAKARDARRISDVKQMQTALDMYFNEENYYPTDTVTAGKAAFIVGQPFTSNDGSKTYMSRVPFNPTPVDDGSCPADTQYIYKQTNNGVSYTLSYCLGGATGNVAAGIALAWPGSINNQCTPNCSGKVCGPDGCGGVCGNCSGGNICKTDGSACVACLTNADCNGGTPYCVANTCSASKATPCADTVSAATECNNASVYGAICGGGYLVCKSGDNDCGNINLVAAPSGCTATTNSGVTSCNSCGADSSYPNKLAYGGTTLLSLTDAVDGRNNFSDGVDGTAVKNNSSTYAAAKYCLDLSITISGKTYDDWYLPASKELAAMVKSSGLFYSYVSTKYASDAYYGENTTSATLQTASTHYTTASLITASADSRVAGLYSGYDYWSSTEYNDTDAWNQRSDSGLQHSNDKTMTSGFLVRCVRRF